MLWSSHAPAKSASALAYSSAAPWPSSSAASTTDQPPGGVAHGVEKSTSRPGPVDGGPVLGEGERHAVPDADDGEVAPRGAVCRLLPVHFRPVPPDDVRPAALGRERLRHTADAPAGSQQNHHDQQAGTAHDGLTMPRPGQFRWAAPAATDMHELPQTGRHRRAPHISSHCGRQRRRKRGPEGATSAVRAGHAEDRPRRGDLLDFPEEIRACYLITCWWRGPELRVGCNPLPGWMMPRRHHSSPSTMASAGTLL